MKKRFIILIAGMLGGLVPAGAQVVLHNVYARETASLNGVWQTIADPFDAGYYDYRLKESTNGFFKNDRPKSKGEHVEYDFSDAETLRVPGDWNTQRRELFFYEGSVWYKRDFVVRRKEGRRLFLYFAAANYQTEVYLNGRKLGRHIGGYTPFHYDITEEVKDGDNLLVVRVNAIRKPEGVPTVNSDWWNYGGITRDVLLVETPTTFIDDYGVKLSKGRYDEITAWARLNVPAEGQEVTLRIPELKIKRTLRTDATGRVAVQLKARPQLWSPDCPRLYRVELSCNGETMADEIGFRHIETRGREILLNGEPVFLRGVSVHEEAPYRTGRCTTTADDSTLISWAKELNCNMLRLAHYPHNEQMVRMAERAGLLLWSEIPVYWTIHWDNAETFANASRQLQDNLDRDHNRCAIIIWSVANETPVSASRNEFLSKLARQVRQNDDERLISMAMELEGTRNDTSFVSDPMNKYVDIISFNSYPGWYGDSNEALSRRQWSIPYDKPFFVSEFGAGCKAGLHGGNDEKWTEEYQAEVYRANLSMYDRQQGWAGCSPWILMDFRSARRQLHGIQDFFNRKGLVSDQGEKKQAFFVLQQFYKKKAADSYSKKLEKLGS